jgi:hypothetical protein
VALLLAFGSMLFSWCRPLSRTFISHLIINFRVAEELSAGTAKQGVIGLAVKAFQQLSLRFLQLVNLVQQRLLLRMNLGKLLFPELGSINVA